MMSVAAIPEVRQEQESGNPVTDGILPIDKPTGMTSHDVVDVIRRLYGVRRVGHTGTLDPAASGLLLLMLGRATKAAPWLTAQEKTYLASIEFGSTSDSGDSEGRIAATPDATPPGRDELAALISQFVGTIALAVPDLSAVHTDGRRRYELARLGETPAPVQRDATIHELALLRYDPPVAEMRVRCSSGTYIRSLASALGSTAGCGAYLKGLTREQIGRCDLNSAFALKELNERSTLGEPLPQPRPLGDFLDLPGIDLSPSGEMAVRHGRPIVARDIVGVDLHVVTGDTVALRATDRRVIAIGQAMFNATQCPGSLPSSGESLFEYQRVLIG
ncbi:MAG: tRNA pseudouridine(55) synthase TruB [candidate division Zixibacteria bacterium]|nr:tRNA pseudouridine(55) synthase TruB [candidate division Zixibacteria bacterium]